MYGGKAVGLGRLIASGARVPAGFAFPAGSEMPARWPAASRDELLARARPLLALGPVAVRSSAPGEDGQARSFAGLFETVLGVTTAEALLEAAARCIASGATERVRAYAGDQAARAVGLVVQSQVAARAAGVCFTVDPAGKDGAVLVEAVPGLGDALVSGRATPERWRVYRSARRGWEAQREDGGPPVLTAGQATEIAAAAAALAAGAPGPLDLEWARDEAGLWWLQARPVTAAAPPRVFDVERHFEDVGDGGVTVWANWNVRETLPDPLTPLSWSLWRDVVLPPVVHSGFGIAPTSTLYRHVTSIDLVHGRVYWNMNALLAGPMGAAFAGSMLAHVDARAAEVTARLVAEGVLLPRAMPVARWRLVAPLALRLLVAVGGLAGDLRPRRALRRLEEEAVRLRRRGDVASLSDEALVAEMAILSAPEWRWLLRSSRMLVIAFVVQALGDAAFRAHPRARRLLTAGVSGNPTTRISLALDDLIEAARPVADRFAEPMAANARRTALAESAEGAAWLVRLDEFLDFAGQRGPKEFDFASPRWADDPTMILDLVRSGLASGPAYRARDRLQRMAGERLQAIAEAKARSAPWRRPLLGLAARMVERFAPLREAPKHAILVAFRRIRLAALEIGRRLHARGSLDDPADVMLVARAEIASALLAAAPRDLRPLVAAARARHARHLAFAPPDFLRSDGVRVPEPASDASGAGGGVLHGLGASSGASCGPVRILRVPDPSALRDGDVLVVPFADPGWTPLFPRAAALVMEVGGLMCHAAVVARELGVPAVFAVAGATTRLADGQRVTVDGDAGTVTPA